MQWRWQWKSLFRSRAARATAHFRRGKELQRLKRLREALDSYNRAIALRPDLAEAINNRGNVLYSLGRFVEAVASYDKAIALKPDCAHQLTNRGTAEQRI
jgi:tetratricopeptide (TPR) repeat protein